MIDFTGKYWLSFMVVIIASILFSYLYSFFIKKLEQTKIILLAVFSGFVSFLIVIMLNTIGFDYLYFDEVFVSFMYIFIGPNKWMDELK